MSSSVIQKAMGAFTSHETICFLRGHWSLSAVLYPEHESEGLCGDVFVSDQDWRFRSKLKQHKIAPAAPVTSGTECGRDGEARGPLTRASTSSVECLRYVSQGERTSCYAWPRTWGLQFCSVIHAAIFNICRVTQSPLTEARDAFTPRWLPPRPGLLAFKTLGAWCCLCSMQ